MEGENKKSVWGVGKFRFEEEQVENWVKLGNSFNVEYVYDTEIFNIVPISSREAF